MKKLCLCMLVCCLAISAEVVKVSQFSPSSQDATSAIQSALDSGAKKVIFDKQAFDYQVTTIFLRSNQEVVFEKGVKLKAIKGAHKGMNDSLVLAKNIHDTIIRGEGDVVWQMNKSDYQNRQLYAPSEHRHLFPIVGCQNITVKNLTIASSGGDGIYVSGWGKDNWSTNVLIEDVISQDNHRQGCSIISAENLTIRNCAFLNTRGTPPAAGIDFEPNNQSQKLVNCVVDGCFFKGNAGGAYGVGVNFTLCAPVSVTFKNCVAVDNLVCGISTWVGGSVSPRVTGYVRYENCFVSQSTGKAMIFNNIRSKGVKIYFDHCTFDFRKAAGTLVTIGTQFNEDVEGIDFCRSLLLVNNEARGLIGVGSLGAAKFCIPEGKLFIVKENGSMAPFNFAPLAKQHPGNPLMSKFASLPLDTRGMKPATAKGKGANAMRLRGNHHFLQYGKAGEPLSVTFTVTWDRKEPIHIPIEVRDSSNTFVKSFLLNQKQQTFTFTPQYDSVFSFAFRTLGTLNITSSRPGQGYDCSKRLGLMSCEGDYYFVVPAGAPVVTVELWGDVNENVQGTLYAPDGRKMASVAPNFGTQFVSAKRLDPSKEEIWRVHVKGREDHAIRLAEPMKPIIYTSPENILK